MDQSEIESLLWDCVTGPDDDTAYRGDQSTAISKLAALIADQQRHLASIPAEAAPQATETSPRPKIRKNLPAPASAEGELFHYTIEEAALWLPFSVVKLRRMIHAREIPHVNNGNKLWLAGLHIRAITEQFTVPVLPESMRAKAT